MPGERRMKSRADLIADRDAALADYESRLTNAWKGQAEPTRQSSKLLVLAGDTPSLRTLSQEWAPEIVPSIEWRLLERNILDAANGGEFDDCAQGHGFLVIDFETRMPEHAVSALLRDRFERPLLDTRTAREIASNVSSAIATMLELELFAIHRSAVLTFAQKRRLRVPSCWSDGIGAPKITPKMGRPFAADWAALEERVRAEIDIVGFPDRNGAPGWQKQADVVKFLEPHCGHYEPGKSALKDNVKRMLKKIASEISQKVEK
jgi:hypothetical protein